MVEHERDSRLMLGTVQFGMPYGMANRTGQPTYRDIRAIVKAAIDGGINGFDTAASYGTAESVLGQVLYELGVSDRVVVVTKVRPLELGKLSDPSAAARAVEQSVARSRRRLRLDFLPVVLFHRESDAVHLPVLRKLSERGWLKHYGVSCENRPGPAAKFVAAGNVSALQLPGNVLDPRHLRSGILEAAADREIRIFVRSIYLQGLLALPEDDIPPALSDIVPILRSLAAIARDAGVSLVELALRYVLSLSGVSSVLVGVETVSQIQDNLVMSDRGPLDTDLLTAIDASIPELPETLITPKLWPRPG
jgi:aryl-alcohol dehydrogenase-like predicted oxidoreductase